MNHAHENPTTTTFDLESVARELRRVDAYVREGHTARTLVRASDLRVVLIALRAGASMREHRAKPTASVHCVAGHVRLHVRGGTLELARGTLLVLAAGLDHDVEAVEESSLLLTLASPSRT